MEYHFMTLDTRIQLDQSDIEKVKPFLHFDFRKAGDRLLRKAQICDRIYFLKKGLVRTYYEKNGKEVTSWFYDSQQYFTSWYSFYCRRPSFESIQILEDSEIYSLSYKDFNTLQENPKLLLIARLIAEESTAFLDYSNKDYTGLSAADRYRDLLHYFPDIELRTKLSYIASFLGVSQETLSRIRSGKM